MTFYHIPEERFPADSQYYFNVMAIKIGINPSLWKEYFSDDITEIWSTERLTQRRPYIFQFHIDSNLEEENENNSEVEVENLDIEFLLHQVVEINSNQQIYLYDMIDFDTEDVWRID